MENISDHIAHRIKSIRDPGSNPRVFIAAHPDEQQLYLERLIGIMHDQQDCIVYYIKDPETLEGYEARHQNPNSIQPGPDANTKAAATPTDAQLADILDDMQLIVAAVTNRMLREPNFAMDRIIPYALEHNIPVLPLKMEEVSSGLFKQRFGDLQYLKPDDPDETAIPFEQKLAAYLEDVLINDKIAKRVRNAFDALVFLSYRKKDRAYARELMRLMHRSSDWRDIAFWYDEFLVPGEDFHDGIQNALDESDLFTLVVTPNLLEDPNFVMNTEYPAARKAGKAVFPVEMNETDREELNERYAELPPCAKGTGDEAWTAALQEQLERLAGRKQPKEQERKPSLIEKMFRRAKGKDAHTEDQALTKAQAWHLALRTRRDEPEHTFLIGLAYLDGINMEVDKERAVAMITEAANAGLEEAMRKLSTMYSTGKGVRRSVDEAIVWQQKLCDRLSDQYRKEKANERLSDRSYKDRANDRQSDQSHKDSIDDLLAQLYKDQNTLGNLLHRSRRIKELYTAIDTQRILAEEEVERGLEKGKYHLAVCNSKCGNIQTMFQFLDRAERSHKEAIRLFEEILEQEGTDAARRDLYIACRGLAELYEKYRSWEEALEQYERARDTILSIEDEEYRKNLSRDLAAMYENCGDILAKKGREEEADASWNEALRIAEEAEALRPSDKNKNGLYTIYITLQMRSARKGDREAEEAYYQKIFALREAQLQEALKRGDGCTQYYYSLGLFRETHGDTAEAMRLYARCMDAPEQDPDSTQVLENRMNAMLSMSKLSRKQGDLDGAELYFGRGVALAEHLCQKTGTPDLRRKIAEELERHAGDDPRGLEEAFAHRQWLAMRGDPDDRAIRDSLRKKIDRLYEEHPEKKIPRILVYEAEESLSEQIRQALEAAGFSVCWSTSFKYEVIRLYDEVRPDLLLYGLSDNGVADESELYFRLRIDSATNVLAYGGEEHREVLERLVEAGAKGYLIKPFAIEEMVERVRRVL